MSGKEVDARIKLHGSQILEDGVWFCTNVTAVTKDVNEGAQGDSEVSVPVTQGKWDVESSKNQKGMPQTPLQWAGLFLGSTACFA